MYAIHKQAVPPSGLSHTISARLTPSCYQSTSSRSQKRIVRQIVAARNNFLQVFDVLEELDEVVQNGSDTQSNGKQPEVSPPSRAAKEKLKGDKASETDSWAMFYTSLLTLYIIHQHLVP